MARTTTHSSYCRKEKEIAEIYTDLKTIKKKVMGNGAPGLDESVPRLADAVDRLEITVSNLDRNVDKIVKKQDVFEGERLGKEEMKRRTRWLVGILAGIIGVLIGGLITLIHLLVESGG